VDTGKVQNYATLFFCGSGTSFLPDVIVIVSRFNPVEGCGISYITDLICYIIIWTFKMENENIDETVSGRGFVWCPVPHIAVLF
jgi:hypothetical protein